MSTPITRYECGTCPRTYDSEMQVDPMGDWLKCSDIIAWHEDQANMWDAELVNRRSWGGPTLGEDECIQKRNLHRDIAMQFSMGKI